MAETDAVGWGEGAPSPEFSPDPRNIVELHPKLNGTDGVSLVINTLDAFLEENGCTVHKCGADIRPAQRGICLAGLSYQTPEPKALTDAMFAHEKRDPRTEKMLLNEIRARAQPLQETIKSYITQHNIGTVVVRNLFSLPLNMPATLALYEILADPKFRGVKFILYHHDFYWETVRNSRFVTPYPEIQKLVDAMYPPKLPHQDNVTHIVLNSIIKEKLRARSGIEAHVLPDPYEYHGRRSEETAGEPLRTRLGLDQGDLMVMVPTRVVPRKAIEFAVSLVAELAKKKAALVAASKAGGGLGPHRRPFEKDSRIVLVLPQEEDMADHDAYADALRLAAAEAGVELLFAGRHVRPPGDGNGGPGDTRIPFYDVYREADVAVFPSVHEGWGNQLHEIAAAQLVPVVFEYDVLKKDIRLPHLISLGSSYETLRPDEAGVALKALPDGVVPRATEEIVAMLAHPDEWAKKAAENREYLAARYDAAVIVQQFLAIAGLQDDPAPTSRIP